MFTPEKIIEAVELAAKDIIEFKRKIDSIPDQTHRIKMHYCVGQFARIAQTMCSLPEDAREMLFTHYKLLIERGIQLDKADREELERLKKRHEVS